MTVSVRRRAARLVAALVVFVTGWLPAGLVGIAAAQETARSGSELVFVVPAEPPSFDAHRKESFALIHPATPHYSTLLRVDPDDPSGTKLVGDLAEWWSSAANGRTWTFKIHRGVKFHDGSELTARDVKASYDTIVFPPAGVASNRKGEYVVVESVEPPDADVLARDIHWYEKNVVGTGRFVFGEYVKGSPWTGRKNRPTGTAASPKIGLTVKVETLELATLCSDIVEPDLALFKLQSADVSHVNYSRYTDRSLDELHQRQSRAAERGERRRAIREFEERLLDDEMHDIFTFQWHRIVPHNARLRGWTITPSHFLHNQLDAVWLAPE